MENNTNSLSWMHGLEEYFAFIGREEARNYVLFILKLLYANAPVISRTDTGDIIEFIGTMRKFSPCPELDMLHKYFRLGGTQSNICDAFSRGQVQSKIWLSTELSNLNIPTKNILILAGWFGQLVRYIKSDYEKIRIVDMDRTACSMSDDVFNLDKLDSYQVKSSACKIEDLVIQKTGFVLSVEDFKKERVYEEKFLPDLIINTSAEHMTDDWFNQIRFKELESNPVVIIQSNNLFDIPEHINCVHSSDHIEKKFPMREILYSGEIQLQGYKRFMLIGRP